MSEARTTYDLSDGIATITMDDGKANALSSAMLAELTEQFARAETDEAVVVLTGRERTFSAGFDLKTAPEGWPQMLVDGATMAERIMSFPRPVVVACNGNAIAMGGFLLLSADVRIGAAGAFRIGLNEVAIGLTLPYFGIAIARHRLSREYFDRATITGALFDPAEAQKAGFLDKVVEPDELAGAAREAATQLAGINMPAHLATKTRVREEAIAGIRDGIDRIENREAADW
jgi:enoyl-CoA hydratase